MRFWHRRPQPGLVADIRGQGKAVVLLHGQPGTAADWHAVAEDLATDYRVIVPDRIGYGRTGGRAGGFAANAAAVVKLMDQLREKRAVVVGHSWAGGAALATALNFPSRVAGLGLVASVAPDEPLSRMDRFLAVPLVGTALGALTLSATGLLLSSSPARALASRHSGGRLEVLAQLGASWPRPSTWSSFATEQKALVNELPLLRPRLGELSLPSAVVVGSTDRVVGTRAGERLVGAIRGATLQIVPGAGHLLPQFEPKPVAAAVRSLVSRCL